MMTYIAITGIAGLSFIAGWIMKSMSVSNLVEKARHDIRYVDVLKSKSYSKGWNTGFEYRSNFERELE